MIYDDCKVNRQRVMVYKRKENNNKKEKLTSELST